MPRGHPPHPSQVNNVGGSSQNQQYQRNSRQNDRPTNNERLPQRQSRSEPGNADNGEGCIPHPPPGMQRGLVQQQKTPF